MGLETASVLIPKATDALVCVLQLCGCIIRNTALYKKDVQKWIEYRRPSKGAENSFFLRRGGMKGVSCEYTKS